MRLKEECGNLIWKCNNKNSNAKTQKNNNNKKYLIHKLYLFLFTNYSK